MRRTKSESNVAFTALPIDSSADSVRVQGRLLASTLSLAIINGPYRDSRCAFIASQLHPSLELRCMPTPDRSETGCQSLQSLQKQRLEAVRLETPTLPECTPANEYSMSVSSTVKTPRAGICSTPSTMVSITGRPFEFIPSPCHTLGLWRF